MKTGSERTTLCEALLRLRRDNYELIVKAANLSGVLEETKAIEVHSWEALSDAIEGYINWYLESEEAFDADFFEGLEEKLRAEFPPDERSDS